MITCHLAMSSPILFTLKNVHSLTSTTETIINSTKLSVQSSYEDILMQ